MTTFYFHQTTQALIIHDSARDPRPDARGSHRSELRYSLSISGSLSVTHADIPDYDGSDDSPDDREGTPVTVLSRSSRQPRFHGPTRTSYTSTSPRRQSYIPSEAPLSRHSDDGVTDREYGSEDDRLGNRRSASSACASRRVRPRHNVPPPVAEEEGEDIHQDVQDTLENDEDIQEESLKEVEEADEEADWERNYEFADSQEFESRF